MKVNHGNPVAYYKLDDKETSDKDIKKRRAAIPAAWAKINGKRSTAVQGCPSLDAPTVRRNPPDAGASRELAELHADYKKLADKYWADEYDDEKRGKTEGRWITDDLQAVYASGYVLLAVPIQIPSGNLTKLKIGKLPDVQADPLALVTADVWRAYARVRTCRPQSTGRLQVVTWEIRDDGIYLCADDGDGNSATEYVPTGTSVPRLHVQRFQIQDKYVWPLRGNTWFLRQDGTPHLIGDNKQDQDRDQNLVWWEHATGVVAVTMPTKY